jgi:hypothetical protein
MATHATIAVVTKGGTVNSVYLHWDGYISGAGKTLEEYYNSQELAEQLVSMGDISSIGAHIDPLYDDACEFYHRDRGELFGTNRYVNVEEYLEDTDSHEEYNYVFKDGIWNVINTYDNTIVPLSEYEETDEEE